MDTFDRSFIQLLNGFLVIYILTTRLWYQHQDQLYYTDNWVQLLSSNYNIRYCYSRSDIFSGGVGNFLGAGLRFFGLGLEFFGGLPLNIFLGLIFFRVGLRYFHGGLRNFQGVEKFSWGVGKFSGG